MKKSISSGMTGWTKKFGGLFRAAPGENGKRKIEISEPLRQVGGTSVDHVQTLFQIRDHLLEIEKSAKYMTKLIEKNQKELIPQVVTLIIDTVQKMLDDIVVIVGRQPEISSDDKWNLFFESRQQEARNYLAALVKLSDSNSEISHDDTQMTQEMVQKLEKVLRNILDYANFKFPVAPVSQLISTSYL
jgi:esterase/lipase